MCGKFCNRRAKEGPTKFRVSRGWEMVAQPSVFTYCLELSRPRTTSCT